MGGTAFVRAGIAGLRKRITFSAAAYSRRRQGDALGLNYCPFSTFTGANPPDTSSTGNVPPASDNFYAYMKYPKQLRTALAIRSKVWSDNPADAVSTVDDFNELFTTLARLKLYSTAIYLIKRIRVLGSVPIDEFTLNVVLNCFCRLDRVHYGLAVVGSFFKHGYAPHEKAPTVLMNGLIGENKIPEAIEVFNMLMRETGGDVIKLELTTQATVMNALFKAGNVEKAIWVSNMMKDDCLERMVCDTIIDGLCLCGLVDSAMHYKSLMMSRLHVGTFNSLIKGFAQLGRWDDVRRMLREMTRMEIQPDAYTHYVLINVLGSKRKNLVSDMLKDITFEFAYPTFPDEFHPRGCLEADQHYLNGSPVETILQLMSGDVDADPVAYNSLMKRYCLDGRMDEALLVFNYLAKNMGFRANIVSYNILINGYCNRMELDEALKLYREITLEAGLRPNMETYNTMLKGLLLSDRHAEAEDIFHEMRNRGVAPDLSTYSALLNSLLCDREVEDSGALWYKWLKPDPIHKAIFNKAEKLLLGMFDEEEPLTKKDLMLLLATMVKDDQKWLDLRDSIRSRSEYVV